MHNTIDLLNPPTRRDNQVARLTELLLMGHTWKSVRRIMMLTKPEFDRVLDRAVEKAQAEQIDERDMAPRCAALPERRRGEHR